jgi:hypothetical protein
VADVDGVSQVEVLDDGAHVTGVVVHVMTGGDLRRAPVAAAVGGDDAVALVEEVEQLRVPVVGREGPAVVEDDGLGVGAAPVLVVDLRAVFGGDVGHDRSSGSCGWVRSI